MMRPGNASSITGESRRMKPASATSSTERSRKRGEDRAVEVLARRKLAMVDDRRLDSVAAGALESLRVGAIRYDETDFGLEIAAQNRVDDRLQVGAGAGNQDAEFDRRIFRHRISRGSANRHSALAAPYFADNICPIFAAAQMSDDAVGLARGHDRDHPEAVVEGAIHFGARDFAKALNQCRKSAASANCRVRRLRGCFRASRAAGFRARRRR